MLSPAEDRIKRLLSERAYTSVLDLCEQDRRFWKALRSSLNEIDESVRWPAIEAVAMLMQRWWQKGHTESVYEYMRRLFWSLSDESGEIGWSAPQVIAETIIRIPELFEPFASMMICLSLEEPALLKSGLWAIGRLGKRITAIAALNQDKILTAFNNNDPWNVALAAWATGEMGFTPALPFLNSLLNKEERIPIYVNGQFYEKTVAQWAASAIIKINTCLGYDNTHSF